jgi:hypothetical protein
VYTLLHVFMISKWSKAGCSSHVTPMGDVRNAADFGRKTRRKSHSEYLRLGWRIIIKIDVKNTACGGICVTVGSKTEDFLIRSPAIRFLRNCVTDVVSNCLLTLILLMWRIWWAHYNASKWQIGFNLAFKGLIEDICKIWDPPYSKHCITSTNGIEVLLLYSDTVGRMLRPAMLVVTILKWRIRS